MHLKSFNARLAVDYPVYSMVICQVIDKLKLVLLFAAQYLTISFTPVRIKCFKACFAERQLYDMRIRPEVRKNILRKI